MHNNDILKMFISMMMIVLALLIAIPTYAADKGNPPVAHWRFDEGGGPTAYDESANNNDGTLYNHTKFVPGKINKVLEFDGTDDYVQVADSSSLDVSTEATVEAWLYPHSFNNSVYEKVNTDSDPSYMLYVGTNVEITGKTFRPHIYTTLWRYGSINYLCTENTWYHVVYTYKSSTGQMKGYINGVEYPIVFSSAPNAGETIRVGTAPFLMGKDTRGVAYFDGVIDDVRIYNYVRTADQILVDYNNGAASRIGAGIDPNEGNPPIAYYSLDENTGTTAYDRSGNGNNGTITNAAWAPGKDSPALSFDGSGDYINAGTGANIASGSLTLEAWIYPTAVGGGYRCIVQKRDASGTQYELYLNNSIGALGYYNGTEYVSSYIPPLNKWTHVAAVNSSGNLKLYADTVQVYSNTGVTIPSFPTAALYIGSVYTGGETFSGKIDDVKIYDYARTQGQIAYDYNKGKPMAHYKFDEGGGKVAYNEFGNIQPNNIPNLKFWLKADAITGLSDGSSVSTWSDSSGNGINFTQPTGSRQPVYKVNIINGCPVLRLAAASQQTMTNSTTFTNPVTVIYIARQTGGTNGRMLTALNNNWLLGYWGGARQQAYFEGWVSSSGTPATDTNWHIYSSVQTGSLSTVYEDGVQFASNANGVTAPNGLCLSGYLGSSEFSDGDIAEVIMYNSALSINDLRSVENYLKNKYILPNTAGYGILSGDTKFVDGKIGKALNFDGSGDYVLIPGSSAFDVQGLTISCWTYSTNYAANMFMFEKTTNGSVNTQYSFFFEGSNIIFRTYGLSTTDLTASSSGPINSQWNHMAATYNPATGTKKIYCNGREIASTTGLTGTINTNANGSSWIGAYGGGSGYPFNGKIDDMRIYNYARTADQVMQDYNAGASARLGSPAAGIADPWGGAMPAAQWKLDENTGALAKDSSGNGNDAAVNSGLVWEPGKYGPALKFDGTNKTVSAPNSSTLNVTGQNLTLEAWINPSSGAGDGDIIHKEGQYSIFRNSNGTITYADQTIWSYATVGNHGSTPNSQWSHVAVTRDASSVKFYINGKYIDPYSCSGSISGNSNSVYIGSYNGTQNYFNGLIDDVRIYNYTRTPAQVAWDYNGGKPVAHWRFNEATSGAVSTSAGAIKDDSGNYNGTASATTFSYASGKYGGALNFDGNDYVSIGNLGLFPTTGSLSFWVNATEMANYRNPFTTKIAGGNAGIRFEENASGNFGAVIGNDGGTFLSHAYISSGMQTSRWYHVTLVWDTSANNVKGYLDGAQVFNDSHTLWPTTLPDLAVGTGFTADAARQWYGLVDDVRIYNYARTADQILQDYNNGAGARLGD